MIRISAIALLVLVGIGYYAFATSTFVVTGSTGSVKIIADGRDDVVLTAERGLLCLRRAKPNVSDFQSSQVGKRCHVALYEEVVLEKTELVWKNGAEYLITSPESDVYEIEIRNAANTMILDAGGDYLELTDNSRIVLFSENTVSALPFSGSVTIGDIPVSGSNRFLTEGFYEVRDALFARRASIPSRSGSFFPGDVVSFVGNKRDEGIARGLVFLDSSQSSGMRFSAYSLGGAYALHAIRPSTSPVLIRSTFLDRIQADPIIIGLSVIFAAFVGILEALGHFRSKMKS